MIIICRVCGSAWCEHGDDCISCGCPECGWPGYAQRGWCPDCGHTAHPKAQEVWRKLQPLKTYEERYNRMLETLGREPIFADMAGKVLFPFEELFALTELDLLENRR